MVSFSAFDKEQADGIQSVTIHTTHGDIKVSFASQLEQAIWLTTQIEVFCEAVPRTSEVRALTFEDCESLGPRNAD